MAFEFKAGKMVFDAVTKRVKPDSRLGKVQILREGPAKVFQWLDRETGQADEGVYLFAQQAIFEKIKQSSARVYVLRYFGSDQRYFFWLQEDDPSKDEELCRKINDLINEQEAERPVDEEGAGEVDMNNGQQEIESEEAPAAAMPGASGNDQAARDAQTISALIQMLAGKAQKREKSTVCAS